MAPEPPPTLRELISRYDPERFELGRPHARIRLAGAAPQDFDAVLEDGTVQLQPAREGHPDALLEADERSWQAIARDAAEGMNAFRRGRLHIRHDLHLGVGFLAATAPSGGTGMRLRQVPTERGVISTAEAGSGPPVLLIHGLGATKVSMLPTLVALAPNYRAIAVDLPGFGDSHKPIGGRYHAPFFAQAMSALLDALGIERADVIGNSMGGRVALEMGLRTPARVHRLVLLAPSLAWLRDRPWAPYLRLVAPQLGLIQPAPRPIVEAIVRRVVPGIDSDRWMAVAVDEFLRSYLTPRGRAAFYAAARNIYLEQPRGPRGFWTRLPALQAPALFVWGRSDALVPIRFARHVREALPSAEHLELNCGHVPQLERPRETHAAVLRFLAGGPASAGGRSSPRPGSASEPTHPAPASGVTGHGEVA